MTWSKKITAAAVLVTAGLAFVGPASAFRAFDNDGATTGEEQQVRHHRRHCSTDANNAEMMPVCPAGGRRWRTQLDNVPTATPNYP